MKIYMFEADWYCKPCGEAIAATLPDPDAWEREHPDSCSYPVAYDSSEGESDTPDHCGTPDCQLFLERPLTDDGREYVREAARTEQRLRGNGSPVRGHTCQPSCKRCTERCAACIDGEINKVVQQWVEFYGIAEATEEVI